MASNMDRSLDEILAERKPSRGRGPRGGNNGGGGGGGGSSGRRRDRDRRSARDEYPRDGVRKAYRGDYEPRKIDEEWVHDRYDEHANPHAKPGRRAADPEAGGGRAATTGTRLRVENLHYDLTRDDLAGLFGGIGRVLSVKLLYDRAGRSEGVAYVTYADYDDAREAVREFDGANAKGQPIRLAIVSSGASSAASKPGAGRPLAERVSRPGQQQPRGRRRQRKNDGGGGNGAADGEDDNDNDDDMYDDNNNDNDDADGADDGRLSVAAAARHGIDRYVPGEGGGSGGGGGGGGGGGRRSRSRSPRPARRREGGRRPGERRRGGNGGGGGGGNGNGADRSSNQRSRKTQEELDAEMEDYFGGNGNNNGNGNGAGEATEYHVGGEAPQQQRTAAAAVVDDDDAEMIG